MVGELVDVLVVAREVLVLVGVVVDVLVVAGEVLVVVGVVVDASVVVGVVVDVSVVVGVVVDVTSPTTAKKGFLSASDAGVIGAARATAARLASPKTIFLKSIMKRA